MHNYNFGPKMFIFLIHTTKLQLHINFLNIGDQNNMSPNISVVCIKKLRCDQNVNCMYKSNQNFCSIYNFLINTIKND